MVLKELGVRGTDTTFHHSTKRDRVVFVDDVPPGLVCPACRDAFVCPMIAPCGHSVCKACSEKVNRATGRCFTCDAPANPVDLDDDGVSAVELGDVRALCRHGVGVREGEAGPEVYVRHDEFNVTACSAGVRLRDLETHEAACQFRPLRCDLRDVVHRDEDGAVVDDVDAVDNKENVVDGWGAGGANDNNNGGYHEDACGAVCLLRDMPAHRAECKNRLVNCPFASAGCEWRGAARRLSDHRNHCRRQPRECPNGCGAMVSVGAMMMKHLERCKLAEVACDAPDAEWDDATVPADDPRRSNLDCASIRARCPAVVKRSLLKKHRAEECAWARAKRCERCRAIVSLRSVAEHEKLRCVAAVEPCPLRCGMVVSRGALDEHVKNLCVRTLVDCPFKSLGCHTTIERGRLEAHVQHAAGKHAELVRSGVCNARERSVALGERVKRHEDEVVAAARARDAETIEFVNAKRAESMEELSKARAHDAAARKRVAADAAALRRAASDQAKTFSDQLLVMFTEVKELRGDFERFRGRTESELGALRGTVEENKARAVELFARVSAERGNAVGRYEKEVRASAEDEEARWNMDVDKQTRALRAEFEDYKSGVNAQLNALWDDVRRLGRRFG